LAVEAAVDGMSLEAVEQVDYKQMTLHSVHLSQIPLNNLIHEDY
jgi:hypothetical protein